MMVPLNVFDFAESAMVTVPGLIVGKSRF